MSERIPGLAQLLPDKSSLEDYTLEELQHLAKRFPYFAPVQFLLLEKMRQSALPETPVQQQKAVLYYHDPLLFDHLFAAGKPPVNEPATAGQEPAFASGDRVASPPLAASTTEAAVILPPVTKKPIGLEEMGPASDERSFATEDETKGEAAATADHIFPEPDKVTTPETVEPAEPAFLPVHPLTMPQASENKGSNEVAEVETNTLEAGEIAAVNEAEAAAALEEAALSAGDEPPALDKTLPPSAEQQATLPARMLPQSKPGPAAEQALFEPFHTVDYFASQGIRITADELPKDKLSKQVRSFTDWLRMMKRLPAAEMAQGPETVAEKRVESLATHSVEGSDVVTEAMAEVWARQGNRQKAIETYNKLSLLNPSKRTYFAAKIENLS